MDNSIVLTEGKFYTDINIINLPIFSATKNDTITNTETIIINTEPKTILNISYKDGKKLTFFDRKILGLIELIYCKSFDFDKLKKAFDVEFNNQKELYKKKYKLAELTSAAYQSIVYNTGSIILAQNKLYLTLSDLNKILNKNKTYTHSYIKDSLDKLSKTTIEEQTTYFIDNSSFETSSFPLLNYFSETEGKTHRLLISLSPFHFLNLLSKKYVASNLNMLSSFNSPIAGRLSEYISKRLYGSKKYNKDYTRINYSDICSYLHLKQHSKKSYILQQLEKPFNELIEKKIIENWKLSDQLDLFDISFEFYHNWQYYLIFFDSLDADIINRLDKALLDLLNNNKEQYEELDKRRSDYVSTVPDKHKKSAGKYFLRYIFYTEFYEKN